MISSYSSLSSSIITFIGKYYDPSTYPTPSTPSFSDPQLKITSPES